MNIIQLNFQTINTALGFDDSLLHKHVQVDKLAYNDVGTLFFISSYDMTYGDAEAYVVCDKKGNVSYFDLAHQTVCYNNQVREDWCPCTAMPSELRESLLNLFDEYCFECALDPERSHLLADGIVPFLKQLKELLEWR